MPAIEALNILIETAYRNGYEDGDADGVTKGEVSGYEEGFQQGRNDGYDEGWDDAVARTEDILVEDDDELDTLLAAEIEQARPIYEAGYRNALEDIIEDLTAFSQELNKESYAASIVIGMVARINDALLAG